MSDKMQCIRERAHQLWQAQGEPAGLETTHWLQAERELHEGGSANANEGEGSQTCARHYDEATTAFAHSGKGKAAAEAAVKVRDSPAEAAKMKRAGAIGKRRSRGEDPVLKT